MTDRSPSDPVDVLVIGGAHNGLVAAAYLGAAGLRVRVLERRDRLGDPAGRFEFMPGYSTAFTNSPGSLDPTVVDDLDLTGHGRRETSLAAVLRDGDVVEGVVTDGGDEHRASTVILAISPSLLFSSLLDAGVDDPASRAMRSTKVRGSAFKIVLGLDLLPDVRGLPDGRNRPCRRSSASARRCPTSSRRSSTGWRDDRRMSRSCGARPVAHVARVGACGPASDEHQRVARASRPGDREVVAGTRPVRRTLPGDAQGVLPGLRNAVVGHRFVGPDEIEAELGMVRSNITHGDMDPGRIFGFRPDTRLSGYCGPLHGLCLTGAGRRPADTSPTFPDATPAASYWRIASRAASIT